MTNLPKRINEQAEALFEIENHTVKERYWLEQAFSYQGDEYEITSEEEEMEQMQIDLYFIARNGDLEKMESVAEDFAEQYKGNRKILDILSNTVDALNEFIYVRETNKALGTED